MDVVLSAFHAAKKVSKNSHHDSCTHTHTKSIQVNRIQIFYEMYELGKVELSHTHTHTFIFSGTCAMEVKIVRILEETSATRAFLM